MKIRTSLSVIAIALSACASYQPTTWVKPGGSQAEFDRTMAKCRMQLRMLPSSSREGINFNTTGGAIASAGRDLQDAADMNGFMNDCLVSEGWTVQAPPDACVNPNVKVGDRVKLPTGQRVVVTQILGENSGCKQDGLPIRVKVAQP